MACRKRRHLRLEHIANQTAKKCVCVNIVEEEEQIRHQDIHTEIERACVANMYNEQCGNNRKTRTAQ